MTAVVVVGFLAVLIYIAAITWLVRRSPLRRYYQGPRLSDDPRYDSMRAGQAREDDNEMSG